MFGKADAKATVAVASGGNGSLDSFADWLENELNYKAAKEDLSRMNREELSLALDGAVDDRFHPEMRRMERQVLLNIVDDAWKNHLLTMDHLAQQRGAEGLCPDGPQGRIQTRRDEAV